MQQCVVLNQALGAVLAYNVSALPCMPCNVTFDFSASVAPRAGQYIGVGFKELAAAYEERGDARLENATLPDYWGMRSAQDGDAHVLGGITGRVLVGHFSSAAAGAGGALGCVRHMRADEAYVGAVRDVADDGTLFDIGLESRSGGSRMALRWTVALEAGATAEDVAWYGPRFGAVRMMWAVGNVSSVSGGAGAGAVGCTAPLGYHAGARGTAPLNFPGYGLQCGAGSN